ncbi:hypothetical protein [Streptomyces purpureus]|nr:hypothetical protein [Streptomyces purpureus]
MTSAAAPVVLALSTALPRYFGPHEYAMTWHARQALRVADKFSPGAGVDVLLYGDPADGSHAEDGIVVRTHVEPDSVEEWADEWATIANTGLAFLGDRRPANRVEQTFAAGQSSSSRPRGALRQVIAMLQEMPEPPLVIFQLDTMLGQEEMVLAIRDAGEHAAFWQLFGWEHAIGEVFWTQEGLYRGRVLPNLAVYFGADWSHRAVARRFSRWRKKSLG